MHISGYQIEISKKVKNGILGTYVEVKIDTNYGHKNRNVYDINKIIEESSISERSKELAKSMFMKQALAEAKVHNKILEEVYFHEVGAIDSIVDIVGTAILVDKINPDKMISSVVSDGYGFIECRNGILPVPVPATTQIVTNSKVKCRQIDIDTELVTPTGATIISELAEEFEELPTMTIKKVGVGVGYKELTIPNILKIYYGESD